MDYVENVQMVIRASTPADYPSIVEVHKSLGIVWPEKPEEAETWAEIDRKRSLDRKLFRWVASVEGRVVGHASYLQMSQTPDRFEVGVEVHPGYRRRGVGSALYEQVMEGLRPHGPRVLRADALANIPEGFDFLKKRGFYEAFRETPVHLDVGGFDFGPYTGLESRLRSGGVEIRTLEELEADPGRDRKVYELYWEVAEDVPHEDAAMEIPSFEEWRKWGLNDADLLRDAYFIALQGDQYVGLRELYRYPSGHALLGSLLGVRRSHRGRGIALAMQLRSIAYARDKGYGQLKTCTATKNVPMQALFDKLGFARDPVWQQCQKDMSPGAIRAAMPIPSHGS